MFTELQSLLEHSSVITLNLAKEGEKLRVTFHPHPKDDADYSVPPLTLVATAEELDTGFVAAIQQYKDSHQTLAAQITQFAAEAEARKAEEERKQAEKRAAKKQPRTKPASGSSDDEEIACCATPKAAPDDPEREVLDLF